MLIATTQLIILILCMKNLLLYLQIMTNKQYTQKEILSLRLWVRRANMYIFRQLLYCATD